MVTDDASAFVSEEFQALCKMLRVAHKTTLPHYPQALGIVERQHQEIVATAKKIFIDIDAAILFRRQERGFSLTAPRVVKRLVSFL